MGNEELGMGNGRWLENSLPEKSAGEGGWGMGDGWKTPSLKNQRGMGAGGWRMRMDSYRVFNSTSKVKKFGFEEGKILQDFINKFPNNINYKYVFIAKDKILK